MLSIWSARTRHLFSAASKAALSLIQAAKLIRHGTPPDIAERPPHSVGRPFSAPGSTVPIVGNLVLPNDTPVTAGAVCCEFPLRPEWGSLSASIAATISDECAKAFEISPQPAIVATGIVLARAGPYRPYHRWRLGPA